MRIVLSLSAAALSAALVQPVLATPITILNPSFEQPGFETYAGSNPNWASDTSWNPNPVYFSIGIYPPATYGMYTDPIPHGTEALGIYLQTGLVNQTTSHVYATNEEYTMSVYVGRRLPDPFPAATEMRLYAGATLLTSLTLPDPGAGQWEQHTMVWGPSSPGYAGTLGLLGSNLMVELFSAAGGGGSEADFDNVQLSFELLPEPASLGLMALGSAAMLRRRRA